MLKVKLLRKSAPFRVTFDEKACSGQSGLYITFLALILETGKVKQFFYRATTKEKIACSFSTLLFAKENDTLSIVTWRYKEKSNLEGFGSQVISVDNLSNPLLQVTKTKQDYENSWDDFLDDE